MPEKFSLHPFNFTNKIYQLIWESLDWYKEQLAQMAFPTMAFLSLFMYPPLGVGVQNVKGI